MCSQLVGFNLSFDFARQHSSEPVIEAVRFRFNSKQKRMKVVLKVNKRYNAEEVAAAEYRLVLSFLQLSQLDAARLLGISGRSSRRFACDEHVVPAKVMAELWSWVWSIARLPEHDQPLAYAALWIISKSKQERRYFAAPDPEEALRTFLSETLPRLRAKSREQ